MNTRDIGKRQVRAIPADFSVREEEDGKQYIEGYFAVFNSIYDIGQGMTESVAPEAFDNTLNGDIRCLTDHDTRLVLGRTTAGTFELHTDSHGLYGRALVNPKDQDAVNTKARVDRHDVTQASFGFDIIREDTEIREDGSVHWTIREVKLYECSVVTFPAYQETNIFSRAAQRDELIKRELTAWKKKTMRRLKGDGIESAETAEAD